MLHLSLLSRDRGTGHVYPYATRDMEGGCMSDKSDNALTCECMWYTGREIYGVLREKRVDNVIDRP